MRNLISMALLIAACTASAQDDTAPSPAPATLLIPGDYHNDEAPDSLGTGWLALAPVKGQWQLASRKRDDSLHGLPAFSQFVTKVAD